MTAPIDNDALSMPPPQLPGHDAAPGQQRRAPHRPADAVSVVSDTSIYGGAMDPVSVTLRGLRKALRVARNAYVAMLKEADTLDDDDLVEFRQDLDAGRRELWQAAWRLVDKAREYADAESIRNQDRAVSILMTTNSSFPMPGSPEITENQLTII